MARARGSNAKMAAAFESIYGTPPVSGFRQLPFVSSNLGAEQGLIADDLLGYGREPLAPSRDVVNNDGDMVVPIDLRAFGNWLKLLFGAPTTSGTTDMTHVFTSGASALPSMAAEIGLPEIPSFGMNKGIRGNTLRVDMRRSGLLSATIGLIAQDEVKAGATAAGTPTTYAIQRFSQFQGDIRREGAALASVVSADFMFSNNLDRVEVIRSDGLIEDADPGMVSMTGNIVVRFANTVLLDQATSGAPCALSFGWAIDATKSLLFEVPSVYLPRAKTPVTGPAGVQATFAWQASRGPGGKTVTATLKNDVASY